MSMEKKTRWSLLILLFAVFGQHAPLCRAQDEDLTATFISVEETSQCVDTDSCDDSASPTGHVLSRSLSAGDWAAERCFSFCSNVTLQGEGLSILENFYNYSGDRSCLDIHEAYICLSACLYTSSAVLESANITAAPTDDTSNCSNLCSRENGICDRAFSTQASPTCAHTVNCRSSGMCEHYCELARQLHSRDQELLEIDLPAGVDGALYLRLVSPEENYDLYAQGVLKVANRTSLSQSLAHYGIVWRVTSTQSSETFYISQHLPFLLSPAEVGPLYRAGSNTMAIQQLQCRQGLQLSYALVSQQGRTNFSQPTAQCFFGNGFPRPPSGIHVKFAFREESPDLEIEIVVDNLSPDHDRVTDYGVQIYNAQQRLTKRALFPNRDSLRLVLVGDEASGVFPHTLRSNPQSIVGVYALPQRNVSLSGRSIVPASNWAIVDVAFPFFPQLNATTCFIATYNRTAARAAVEFRVVVHSGWLSLAPLVSVRGSLVLEEVISTPFGIIVIPKNPTYTPRISVQVNTSEYKFVINNIQVPENDEDPLSFSVQAIYIPGIFKQLTSDHKINLNITDFKYSTTLTELRTCPEDDTVTDGPRDFESSGRFTTALPSLILACLIPALGLLRICI